jgi:uncharacterized protein
MTPTVQLRTVSDGILLPVRVVPRASRTEIDGTQDGAIRVRLKAPPVEGAANEELRKFIAKRLKIPREQVEIASGARARSKTLLIRGMTSDVILAALLAD